MAVTGGSMITFLWLSTVLTATTNAFVLCHPKSRTSTEVTPRNNVIGRRIDAGGSLQRRTPGGSATSLWGRRSSDHSEDQHNNFLSRNNARTDVRSFLTQRSIQSFVYLLNQCREEHTVRWMEKTLDFTNIDEFHGTGAFNQTTYPQWDSIFLDYMSREEEVLIISVRQRRRRRGLSGMNSYLDSLSKPAATINPEEDRQPEADEWSVNPHLEEKTVDFEFDIDPSGLVRRILSVREQLSKEWIQDLDMLMKLNDDVMEAYEEYLDSKDEAAMKDDDVDDDDEEDDIESSPNDDDDESIRNLLAPYSVPEPRTKEHTPIEDMAKRPIIDRNAVFAWSQSLFAQDRDSSPFRETNFDLLLLLSTQESIHRVLKRYKKNDGNVSHQTYEWLLDFYKDRVKNHFDGHQTFGRAEDFLEELLQTNPIILETKNEVVAFIDPARIAEDIVRERSEVAIEWMSVAKTIPNEHTDLRRMLLTNTVTKALPWQSTAESILAESGAQSIITNKNEAGSKDNAAKGKVTSDEDEKFKNAVGVFE